MMNPQRIEKGERMFCLKTPESCHVVLLAGGNSGERSISLASGEGAEYALKEAGFHVTILDPSKKEDLVTLLTSEFDVAFLCLHGPYGEDGSIQGMLELVGLPYIGSDVFSSALAMDKEKSKWFYERAGLPILPSVTVEKGFIADIHTIESIVGKRCVVKPLTGGSALGVKIVQDKSELTFALDNAFFYDKKVMVERYVEGTEFTVAVLGNKKLNALPVIEIIPRNEFYDFDAKYAPGGSKHICPARLSEKDSETLRELAIRAHRALGCFGVSRSDFIMDDEGNPWILETNTIPGMTKTSLLPDAAQAAGISFSELCKQLINYAFERAYEDSFKRMSDELFQ